VKKVLFAVVLVATCVTAALAADHKPVSIGPYISVPAQPGTPAVMTKDWQPNSKPAAPPFCKGTACLYYSGDFDASNSAANGSCAINNTGLGDDCVLYEAVKPAKTATVAGGAVTILLENTVVGTNPTPFTVYTGVATGKNGKAVCSTKGFAAVAVYGQSGFGITQYSYSIKKLKKTCTLTAGNRRMTTPPLGVSCRMSKTVLLRIITAGSTSRMTTSSSIQHLATPHRRLFGAPAELAVDWAAMS